MRYFRLLPRLRQLLREQQPDIVHAHRVSSNGLLLGLTDVRPAIVSAWGDDVYLFPNKSVLHRAAVRFALRRADVVLSTSRVMAHETAKYTARPIYETPFGVDLSVFSPEGKRATVSGIPDDALVIGTVKTMEEKYGVDVLIRAFHHLFTLPEGRAADVRLLLVGPGSRLEEYRALAQELGVGKRVVFTGGVPFATVPDYHRRIDIFAALSVLDSESFGVSIIEAGGCAKPCVVSDAGGPAEVIVDGETGYIVPKRDVTAAARALARLVEDAGLRRRMGEAGRAHVRSHYAWEDNLDRMLAIYGAVVVGAPIPLPAVVNG